MNINKGKTVLALLILIVLGVAVVIAERGSAVDSSLPVVNEGDFVFSSSTKLTSVSRTFVDEAPRILARSQDFVIFKPLSVNGWFETYIYNSQTKQTFIISTIVSSADISPLGQEIMITTDGGQLVLVAKDGRMTFDQGFSAEYADSVSYSPDGLKIAYIKAEKKDPYAETIEATLGVAVLDLSTGIESFIVPEAKGEDIYGIAGWAPDGSRIFYESTQNDVLQNSDVWATWSVSPDGEGIRQETNTTTVEGATPYSPQFGRNLLWDVEGYRAFSEMDGEIWVYQFDKNWHVVSQKKFGNGKFLQWENPGKTLAFREHVESRLGFWRMVTINELQNGGVQ